MAKIKGLITLSVHEAMEHPGLQSTGDLLTEAPLQTTALPFLKKINLLDDPSIPFLGISPRKMKTNTYTKSCLINVHSSFIGNSPKLENTQIFTSR